MLILSSAKLNVLNLDQSKNLSFGKEISLSMLWANMFNFKILLSGRELILYHTIQSLNDLEEESV